jgi:hypothetical protein
MAVTKSPDCLNVTPGIAFLINAKYNNLQEHF